MQSEVKPMSMPTQPELPLGIPPALTPTQGIILADGHWWYHDPQGRGPRGPFLTEAAAERAYMATCERLALAIQVPQATGSALRIAMTPEGHLELSGDGARTVIPITPHTGQAIRQLLLQLDEPRWVEPRQWPSATALGVAVRHQGESGLPEPQVLPPHGKARAQKRPGAEALKLTLADLGLS